MSLARRERRNGTPARCAVGAVCALLLFFMVPGGAQPVGSASEQSIKAAYLYQFVAYVQWPEEVFADTSAPLTIGVYESEALADELRAMTAGRKVHGRPLAVRQIRDQEPLDGLQVLFVSEGATGELGRLAAAASPRSVLVVTETGNALELGSVINFRAVDQRIRFDVSLESADNNRLRLSSRLLAVAEFVQPRRQ